MSYKVKVNETMAFDISLDDIEKFDAVETSKNRFHILKDNKSFAAEITHSDFNRKTFLITINNTKYNICIENDLDILLKSMGFEVGAKKQINSIDAPMPGLVLEINVEVGQTVNEDDPLLILEAMKMENSITSPINGTIKSIAVNKGDAVDKNQLLIEFE